jgi:hypothetical protein
MSNDEVTPPFDKSFYVLLSIGYWILTEGALDSEAGRAQIRQAFAGAMLRNGSFEDLKSTPEFLAVMEDQARIQARADAGEFDEPDITGMASLPEVSNE